MRTERHDFLFVVSRPRRLSAHWAQLWCFCGTVVPVCNGNASIRLLTPTSFEPSRPGRATVTAHGGLGCFDKVDQVKPECSLGSTVVFHGTVAPVYDGNAHTIGTARRGAGAALQHSAADSSDHAGAHCEYR